MIKPYFRNCLWLLILTVAFPVWAQPYEVSDTLPKSISLKLIEHQGSPVNFAYSGDPSKPGIVFIHGTPGGWQAFQGYLADPQLQQDFFMVSVDRPGWGGSRGSSVGPDVKLFDFQAAAIVSVLNEFPDKKWLVLGHSLGASIAPKLALQAPDQIRGLLLLAGSHKPSLGSARCYNLAASTLLVRWMLPENLKYSNDEIMALKNELKHLEKDIEKAMPNIKVIVMQGMKDRLVSPKNIDYAEQSWATHLSQLELIRLTEAGHFLPWENADKVREAISRF